MCRKGNVLLHWQKCLGCYFLSLGSNFYGVLANLKECAFLGKCPSIFWVSPDRFTWHLSALLFHSDWKTVSWNKIFLFPLPHPIPTPRVSKTAEFIPSSGKKAIQLHLSTHFPYFPASLYLLFPFCTCIYCLSFLNLSSCPWTSCSAPRVSLREWLGSSPGYLMWPLTLASKNMHIF